MKKSRIIAFLLLLIIVIGMWSYNYAMHGGARNLSEEAVCYTVTSKNITAEFTTDPFLANRKYLDRAVAVKGTVTHKKGNEIILDNVVVCVLSNPNDSIKISQSITLKGRIVGYDDMMEEIKLDQCAPIQS